MQMSGLVQPSSVQNWLGSQGSSSGLIAKRTIRVDIPVDQYPNVGCIFLFHCIFFMLWFTVFDINFLLPTLCCSTILLVASLVLEGTPSREWR